MSCVRARAFAAALATMLACGGSALGADGPLAGIVLDDDSGRTWHLSELAGAPVLVVVADRAASAQANDWGARLAGEEVPLAPWRAQGKVAWLAVANLAHVPDYARNAARDRLREREAGRSAGERRQSSPLLLDWSGILADRLRAERGEALLVLLGGDGRALTEARGSPSEAAVARLRESIIHAVRR